jgi:phosphohistidine phosphatase SixA
MGKTLSPDRRYVILVRHASRDFKSNPDESKQKMSGWRPDFESVTPDFEVKGLPLTLAIAHRLADELGPVKVTHVWHSPHVVAGQTAEAYRWVVSERTQHVCSQDSAPALGPDRETENETAEFISELLTTSDGFGAGSAILVVGHQPMLTRLARLLTRKKLPVDTLPLGGSEAACLEMQDGKAAALIWMLTEKSSDLLADLKEKIKSKYDVAKFFLGAFVVNTGFVLSGEVWKVSNPFSKGLVFAGFFLTLVALALTAATLLSYDALLMPKEFWTGSSAENQGDRQHRRPNKWSVQRPPSQAQIVLFYEMVHVWKVFFLPALFCALAAVFAFLVALAHNSLYPGVQRSGSADVGLGPLMAIAAVAVGALVLPLVFYYRRNRPNLGFED